MIEEWRTSEHEHAHHFWDRRRLYPGRTIVASDGIASRQCVVGKNHSHQFDSARHYGACWSNVESLAGSRVDLSSQRPFQRLALSAHRLFLLHVRLLLVASVSA